MKKEIKYELTFKLDEADARTLQQILARFAGLVALPPEMATLTDDMLTKISEHLETIDLERDNV